MHISSFLAYLVILVKFWRSWEIFNFDHILPNILVLSPKRQHPYNFEETWYDHEIAYLTMNYGPEDVVKISASATKQNPRSQGDGTTPPEAIHRVKKRVARQPLNICQY